MRSVISHILITIILAAAAVHAQSPKHSLYIASCEAAHECKEQTIRRFVFQDGKLTAEEIVATFPREGAYFDANPAQIIENRYLVSPTGATLDLADKKLYAQGLGKFETFQDGKIVILQEMFVKKGGFNTYILDLATKTVKTYKENTFYRAGIGLISPDGNKIAHYNFIHDVVIIYTKSGKDITRFDGGQASGKFRSTCGNCQDKRNTGLPMIWLDSERLLAQRENGKLEFFDFRTKHWSGVVNIDLPKNLPMMPGLYFDEEEVIYYRADQIYKIDVEKKTYTPADDFGLGNGFRRRGEGGHKQFIYEGKPIGTFVSFDMKTVDGYLAAEFQEEPTRDSPPLGVRVWSRDTRTWTTLTIAHRANLIGWVTEP